MPLLIVADEIGLRFNLDPVLFCQEAEVLLPVLDRDLLPRISQQPFDRFRLVSIRQRQPRYHHQGSCEDIRTGQSGPQA